MVKKTDYRWKDFPKDGTQFEAWLGSAEEPHHVIMKYKEEDDWRCSHHYTETTVEIISDFPDYPYPKNRGKFINYHVTVFQSLSDLINDTIQSLKQDKKNFKSQLKNTKTRIAEAKKKLNESTNIK